jgi:hypothetical protein
MNKSKANIRNTLYLTSSFFVLLVFVIELLENNKPSNSSAELMELTVTYLVKTKFEGLFSF